MNPELLDDAAMQSFIREGFIQLQSTLDADFHARIHAALEPLDEGGPYGHNNLLPAVPALAAVLNEPVVAGALESILGRNYMLHFHRHDHVNFPDEAQPLHKDGDNHSHYAVDGHRRMHRTRFAMLFYYPQDTPLEKGPTGIVPRSQYLPRFAVEEIRGEWGKLQAKLRADVEGRFGRLMTSAEARNAFAAGSRRLREENPALVARMAEMDAPWEQAKVPLTGPAGSVTIVHFDAVHGRFSGNQTNEPRHMVKFLFARAEEPTAPSWNSRDATWPTTPEPLDPVWSSIWDWHGGNRTSAHTPVVEPPTDEAAHMARAYSMGATGRVDALLDEFFADSVSQRTFAAYGLIESGSSVVPRLREELATRDVANRVRIIDVLGEIGPPAAQALLDLIEAAEDAAPSIRRYAIEALGTVGQGSTPRDYVAVGGALAKALRDEDAITRRNAAFAIARLAPRLPTDDNDLIAGLEAGLHDWHHHVRGWAIEALRRLPSADAQRRVVDHLLVTRWDPAPKSGDRQPHPHRPLLEHER